MPEPTADNLPPRRPAEAPAEAAPASRDQTAADEATSMLAGPVGGVVPALPAAAPLLPEDAGAVAAPAPPDVPATSGDANVATAGAPLSVAPAATSTALLGTPPEEPTVGTGSIIAIGCGAGTLVFVIFVIVVAFWLR